MCIKINDRGEICFVQKVYVLITTFSKNNVVFKRIVWQNAWGLLLLYLLLTAREDYVFPAYVVFIIFFEVVKLTLGSKDKTTIASHIV